jgi:Fe-S cluster assembly protein SufD
VIVDGRFSRELSSLDALPEGVEVLDLLEAAAVEPGEVRRHLGRHADVEKNPFVALNTAFIAGGVFVRVAEGVKLEKPIHLLFVTTGEGGGQRLTVAATGEERQQAVDRPPMACPRALIVAADRAQFTIVESFAGPEGAVYFTNAVTEIVAGEDCVIDHNTLNAESRSAYHVATMETTIGARTRFYDHSCTIGGRMTRNDLNVHLAGEAADATLNGVVLLDGDQHCDNHTLLDHQFPNCPSYELYKHVLDGRASGVFKGQIFVHRPAQKTNAVQNSRSLLLSGTATMNSQPALEIYADDVKCTHGSTTGPLDEGAVFYLNSRGVSTDTARRLLTYAFAADVTRRIKVAPVRERVEGYMARQHGLPTDFRIQDLAEATEDVVF